jgi:hypothetical protein
LEERSDKKAQNRSGDRRNKKIIIHPQGRGRDFCNGGWGPPRPGKSKEGTTILKRLLLIHVMLVLLV